VAGGYQLLDRKYSKNAIKQELIREYKREWLQNLGRVENSCIPRIFDEIKSM
jgi:hypothetical protein